MLGGEAPRRHRLQRPFACTHGRPRLISTLCRRLSSDSEDFEAAGCDLSLPSHHVLSGCVKCLERMDRRTEGADSVIAAIPAPRWGCTGWWEDLLGQRYAGRSPCDLGWNCTSHTGLHVRITRGGGDRAGAIKDPTAQAVPQNPKGSDGGAQASALGAFNMDLSLRTRGLEHSPSAGSCI